MTYWSGRLRGDLTGSFLLNAKYVLVFCCLSSRLLFHLLLQRILDIWTCWLVILLRRLFERFSSLGSLLWWLPWFSFSFPFPSSVYYSIFLNSIADLFLYSLVAPSRLRIRVGFITTYTVPMLTFFGFFLHSFITSSITRLHRCELNIPTCLTFRMFVKFCFLFWCSLLSAYTLFYVLSIRLLLHFLFLRILHMSFLLIESRTLDISVKDMKTFSCDSIVLCINCWMINVASVVTLPKLNPCLSLVDFISFFVHSYFFF